MTINRGGSPRHTPRPPSNGLPTWMIFLVGTAVVFGGFYLWQGAQNFIRTGGLGVEEATRRAEIVSTATTERLATRPPTREITQQIATPIPDCTEFRVIVPNAIVRESPTTSGAVIRGLTQGVGVCVLGRASDEWYTVDGDPDTRRRELAYMHESVIEATNPTATASITSTPLPTVTDFPTPTITLSPTTEPTETRDPELSDTPRPTRTPTPTPQPTITEPPRQSA